jgi:hypothetical protein
MRLSSFLCGRLGVEICHHAASEVAAAISAAFDESVSSCNLQLCQQWDPAWGEAGPYLRLRSVYSVVSFLEGWAMPHLTPHDVMTMFMALAVLLGCAKLAAELMQKIGQPSILGEISVGIFLGPTVLGRFRPHVYEALFPTTGPMPIVLDTVTTLGGGFLFADGRFGDRSAQHLPARQERPAGESFRGGIPLRSRLPGGQHFPQYLGAQEGANPLIFALLALREMCEVAAEAVRNAPERLFRLVSERERIVPSGWEMNWRCPMRG